MQRRVTFAALLAFIFIPLSLWSASADYLYESEHWYGRSYESDNGQFDICVTSLHNDQEQYLFIRMDRNHRLSVGVGDASWTAKVGEIVQASLHLDHISLFTGSASAVGKDLFAMDLPNANQTLADMSVAKIMLLKIGAHSAMFRLEGIEGALDALFDCVDHGVSAHATT